MRYLHKACWKVLKSEKIMISRLYRKVYPSLATVVEKSPLVPPWCKRKYDFASVCQPHSGLLPSHPHQNINDSIRCQIPHHIKMSALLLKLGDVPFYDFVNLVCQKK